VQGGLLTVEDLAYLTWPSPTTVRRDLAECRANGVAVPTRGQIRDIGPGVSHKAQVVQLYLWGLQFSKRHRCGTRWRLLPTGIFSD
jgi:DeoR/GlpR family transcriptional regulator of sugar metabolism